MTTTHSYNAKAIISRSPWFKSLPDTALAELTMAARIELMKAPSYLFEVGQPSDHVYCVLSGWIRASVVSAFGDEFALSDLKHESWIGEAGLFNDKPRLIDMQVKRDAWVLKIPRAVVLKVGEQHPSMYRDLSESQAENARGVYELFAGMVLYPLKARLAGRLLAMADILGEPHNLGVCIPQKMNQTDLARLCLGSRQRVNKILRDWDARDLVVNDGEFYVLRDLEKLAIEVDSTDN